MFLYIAIQKHLHVIRMEIASILLCKAKNYNHLVLLEVSWLQKTIIGSFLGNIQGWQARVQFPLRITGLLFTQYIKIGTIPVPTGSLLERRLVFTCSTPK